MDRDSVGTLLVTVLGAFHTGPPGIWRCDAAEFVLSLTNGPPGICCCAGVAIYATVRTGSTYIVVLAFANLITTEMNPFSCGVIVLTNL